MKPLWWPNDVQYRNVNWGDNKPHFDELVKIMTAFNNDYCCVEKTGADGSKDCDDVDVMVCGDDGDPNPNYHGEVCDNGSDVDNGEGNSTNYGNGVDDSDGNDGGNDCAAEDIERHAMVSPINVD